MPLEASRVREREKEEGGFLRNGLSGDLVDPDAMRFCVVRNQRATNKDWKVALDRDDNMTRLATRRL